MLNRRKALLLIVAFASICGQVFAEPDARDDEGWLLYTIVHVSYNGEGLKLVQKAKVFQNTQKTNGELLTEMDNKALDKGYFPDHHYYEYPGR